MFITRLLLGLAMLAACALAPAQTSYPDKPIRLVVPYPPGGAADVLARTVAKRLGDELKQNVIVENKPGANGFIGARDVAAANPDGYSLVLVTDGLYSIAPWLLQPGQKDPVQGLAPVIHLVDDPLVIVARPGLGVDNLKQLIELAKKSQTDLTFAANNTTSTHFLAMQVLMKQAGIQMRHIPYAGSSQSIPDLVAGRLDLLVGSPTSVDALVRSGKGLKYIAVTTKDRYPGLPSVPAVSETLSGYDQPAAMGLMVTKGTPQPVIALLNKTITGILAEPEVGRVLLDVVGGIPKAGTPEQFGELITRQRAAREPLLQSLGLIGKP